MTGFCFTWLNFPRIGPRLGSRLSLAETTLSFTGAASMCLLSHLEHTKSIRPSALLHFHLFFSVLFDAIQLRTLWEIQGLETVAQVFSSAFVLKVALLVFEATEKGGVLNTPYRSSAPEAKSGLYNRSLFWWLKPFLAVGFKRPIGAQTIVRQMVCRTTVRTACVR